MWNRRPRSSTACHTDEVNVTFEDFLNSEMAGLARVAGALTGNRHLAEDVLSDALLIASTRWHRIARMENPRAYVRRIVVNVYLSEHRKSRRRRTEATADSSLLDQVDDHDPLSEVESRDAIERMLAQLTPPQRAAVVMRYVFDQADDDIAAVLSCSASTVRSHLSHARAALRLAAISAERG
jgi:RNA polymerase sigma factor (sigma-70 family)